MKTANFSYPNSGLGLPFPVDAAIGNLPVYRNAKRRAGTLIEPLLEFINDGNYIQGIRAIPSTQLQQASNVIPANSSYEDQISIPPGSFLIMIAGVALHADGVTIGNFRVQIFETGSQSWLSNDFVNGRNVSGFTSSPRTTGQPQYGQNVNYVSGFGTDITSEHGPFILPAPIAVSSPGQLMVRFVNLDSVTNTVDMAFYFAVPIGGNQQVGPMTDLTGNVNRRSVR